MTQPRLRIVPLGLREANAFVAEHHRHSGIVRGCKFCLGVADETNELRGVAIIGRPVSRHRDDGLTAEVSRLATDGCENACSALYAAAWRACRAMGYVRLGTYTLVAESGSSLRAAGWQLVGSRPARKGWADSSVKLRSLRDPVGSGGQARQLWEATA